MPIRFLLLLLLVWALGAAAPAGAVEVEGDRLVADGEAVQLRGVSRSGTEYACVQGWGIFDGPVDSRAVDAMRAWNADTVRVPLNEACWLGTAGTPSEFSGARYRSEIERFVDRLLSADLTVVLDLHWSDPRGPATGQASMADSRHSVEFWGEVAATFADRESVLFEVYNEPHSVGWECWRDGCGEWAGMQQLVDAIRRTGARQPMIVNGLEWGNDLRGWQAHRPEDPLDSLVAGVHAYDSNRCATVECWDRELAPLAAQVPVVVTEFGSSHCTGSWAESLMDWSDRHGVSYIAWSWNVWDCAGGPALITSYDGTPSVFGAAVKDHYLDADSGRFVDDDGLVHEEAIERLSAMGITHGCNPPRNDRFCPRGELTRGQAAAFFARVFGLEGGSRVAFRDVAGSPFGEEIRAVAAAGTTRGCNPPRNDRYCPDDPITRAQWASFLARALDLRDPVSAPRFDDVDGLVHRDNIERIAAAGLTHGCNPPRNDRFCPAGAITRAEAASFFSRVLDRAGR